MVRHHVSLLRSVGALIAAGLLALGLAACAMPDPIPGSSDGRSVNDAPTAGTPETGGSGDHKRPDGMRWDSGGLPPPRDAQCPRTDARVDGLCRPREAGADVRTDGQSRDALDDVTKAADLIKAKADH
jgi:hypothetical protein